MKELGLAVVDIIPWFSHVQKTPYVVVSIPDALTASWPTLLAGVVRRCYITDEVLKREIARTRGPLATLIDAKLPDYGATMSGDFGEILTFLYHAAAQHPIPVVGPKKWRLKQDRTKPAPHSDVVHFLCPNWPTPSDHDCVICSEVKSKATPGSSLPISAAIEDCQRDKLGRLSRTLVWLHERALGEDLGTTSIAHLERFIHATDHPPARHLFHAVAVICADLLSAELKDAPDPPPSDCALIIISVPRLKPHYQAVYDAARLSLVEL